MLTNIKNAGRNKEIVEKIENRISDLKNRIKRMIEREKKKKKMWMRH